MLRGTRSPRRFAGGGFYSRPRTPNSFVEYSPRESPKSVRALSVPPDHLMHITQASISPLPPHTNPFGVESKQKRPTTAQPSSAQIHNPFSKSGHMRNKGNVRPKSAIAQRVKNRTSLLSVVVSTSNTNSRVNSRGNEQTQPKLFDTINTEEIHDVAGWGLALIKSDNQ